MAVHMAFIRQCCEDEGKGQLSTLIYQFVAKKMLQS